MLTGGLRVVRWSSKPRLLPRRHTTLSRRPSRFWLLGPTWSILMDWVPYEGIWPWKLFRGGPDGELLRTNDRPEKPMAMKKRQALGLADVAPVPLSSETKLFAKYPKLVGFLIDTKYDDGSIRQPGEWRLANKKLWLTLTLLDPDSGMQLPCTGSTLDDAFSLAEKLLGAEDAPWEVNRWLTTELEKKVKKGGSGKKKK